MESVGYNRFYFNCCHVHLQYCSGTFLQRATLEKHTESFHVELQCGYCGSTFVGTESVVEHVKDAHQASKVTSTENYQDMYIYKARRPCELGTGFC